MASDLSFTEYVRDQMRGAGHVTFKKMFGEYAMYLDEKVVALVCDNQLFVRPTDDGRAWLGRVTEGAPYPGAKPHLLIAEELEDQELVGELIRRTARALPAAKPKKGESKAAAKGGAASAKTAKSAPVKAKSAKSSARQPRATDARAGSRKSKKVPKRRK